MKILYFSYGGGHANIVRMLYKGIEKKQQDEQKIVALTVSWLMFEEDNIPYVRLSDYAHCIKDWDKIIEIGRRLAEHVDFLNPDLLYEDYCAYLGIGYYCLLDQYGEEKAKELYAELGRKAFCPVKIVKQILAYEKPDVVVITCGVRIEKAAGIAANELGIPVIRIADLPEFEPSGCKCITCVMNDYAKIFTTTVLNENPDRVYVTGQPVFEDNLIIDEDINKKVIQDLSLSKFTKLLIYLEEPGLPETTFVENELFAMSVEHNDWLFIIKQHPNQNEVMRNGLRDNVIFLKKYPLKYLLYNCDLAITKYSTAGLEAVLLDKTLINIEFSPLVLDFSKFGISYKVQEKGNFRQAIYECLNTNSQVYRDLQKRRILFKNKPNAVDNIYQVIETHVIKGNQ